MIYGETSESKKESTPEALHMRTRGTTDYMRKFATESQIQHKSYKQTNNAHSRKPHTLPIQ